MSAPQWIMDRIESPEPSPLDAMILAEERSDAFVRVPLMGCRAWSATELRSRPCPVCKGLPLAAGWYCLACDRPKGSLARTVKAKGPKTCGDAAEELRLAVKTETRKEKRAKKNPKREAA